MKKLFIIFALMAAAILSPIRVHSATVSWNLATTSTILNNMMGAPKNVTVNGKVIAMDFSATGVADVIQSTNGVDWSYTTRNASIGGVQIRAFSNVNNAVVSAGTIYVFGGQTPWDNNDVFESSDDGVTWTKHGDSAVNFDVTDSFVATHGSFFMLHKTGTSSYSYMESTDGLNWTSNGTFNQIGAIPTLLYVPSIDKLVFLSTDSVSGLTNVASAPRVFSSPLVETGFTSIPVRTVYGAVVNNNRIYFIGGFGNSGALNDVWYINPSDIGSLTDASFIQDTSIGIVAQDKRYALMPVSINDVMVVFGGITLYPGRIWVSDVLVVDTPTASVTPTITVTLTVTPSNTRTITRTVTSTRTATMTKTPYATATRTWTVSQTPTVTNTVPTNTVTLTPTKTPTPKGTPSNTPVQTPTPIPTTYLKFLDYAACSECADCGFTLQWNKISSTTSGDAGVFYRVYYNGDYADYEDVTNDMTESNATNRIVYTLEKMARDKVYTIQVAAFYVDSPYSSTSNAITISCLETPTPFAGTPTVTNTPDCTLPTNTPSPVVTCAKTVEGLIAYENWDGANNTVGAVPTSTAYFSWAAYPGIVTMVAKDGISTNQCVMANAELTYDQFTFRPRSMAVNEYVAQFIYAPNSTDSWARNRSYSAAGVTSGVSEYIRLPSLNMVMAGNFVWTNDHAMFWANNTSNNNVWEVNKAFHGYYEAIWSISSNDRYRGVTATGRATIYGPTYGPQVGGFTSFTFDTRSTAQNARIDDLMITSGNYVKITGLTQNDVVSIEDTLGNILFTAKAPATKFVTFDTNALMFPLGVTGSVGANSWGGVKFKLTAPNGLAIYESPSYVTNVVGGDTWIVSRP